MDPETMGAPPQPEAAAIPLDPSAAAPVDPNEPISEDQYKELVDLLEKVKQQSANIGSANFVLKNEGIQHKRDALKEVFAALAADGVDLTDPTSVGEFTQKLQQENPDLYELFVHALDQLMNENQDNGQAQDTAQPEVPGVS